ncbi:MAG: TIM barrel protein [Rhodobacteraceae bacterium]|nr:TIM barrel protein [Paracoccaceae bacterium]
MALPVPGAALHRAAFDGLRDWLFDSDRPVEVQDFVYQANLTGDALPLLESWRRALEGHRGRVGLHGPFYGFDLDTTDSDVRAIAQSRLLRALEMGAALGAGWMVVHSPFSFWHALNEPAYPGLHAHVIEAVAECLAPVLARAGEAGIRLVLENVNDARPEAWVALADTIGHPALSLSLDTGHAALAHGQYGAPPVAAYVAAGGARIAHAHLQDCDGRADWHWHPGAEGGVIPWAEVLPALAQAAPDAALILEVRERHEALPQTVARLAEAGLAR